VTDSRSSRPPLDRTRLAALPQPWTGVEVVATCPSTNAALAARARAGAAAGLVLVAEHQTAGRGRLDRSWETPDRAALTFSVLLRPSAVPQHRWSWLPLLAGVAVADGILAAGGPPCALKWPNDVMYDGAKLAGLLAERTEGPAGAALVLGIGLNVSTRAEELPVATATSLALSGMADPDRTGLLLEVLRALGRSYADWVGVRGDTRTGLHDEYVRRCDTVGRPVRVHHPSGETSEGTAVDVDEDGALVVRTGGVRQVFRAGDVVHVRTPRGDA
jgi:BirA family biotin operon repressor/biotin-[acetyl-CoA-carboxylase] ligase